MSGILHVRICGEGAAQAVPLPGTLTPKAMPLSIFFSKSKECALSNFFVSLGAGDAQALACERRCYGYQI
jgi:hypothetical protein